MESTHHRTGEKALLSYNVSKETELSNPMDLNSAPTGNTCFVLTEIYESKAGVLDHFEQTRELGRLPRDAQVDGEVQSHVCVRSFHHQLALVKEPSGIQHLPMRSPVISSHVRK